MPALNQELAHLFKDVNEFKLSELVLESEDLLFVESAVRNKQVNSFDNFSFLTITLILAIIGLAVFSSVHSH